MDNEIDRIELLITKLKDKNTIIISDRHEDYLNSMYEYNKADIKELNKFLIFVMTGTPMASRITPPKMFNEKINSDTVKILGKIILTKTDTYFNFKNPDRGDYFTKFLMEEL